jgi:hypothetical protein
VLRVRRSIFSGGHGLYYEVLISDELVFLHGPKTGGTFVTEVLTDVFTRLSRPLLNQDKHGGVDDIPPEHASKRLTTAVRNPFDFYASHYRFGYWIDRDMDAVSLWQHEPMRKRFVSYPYVSFAEFVEGALRFGNWLPPRRQYLAEELKLGPATITALMYSVRRHVDLLEDLARSGDTAPLKEEVARTKLLHTESLSRDTYCWLLDLCVPHDLARIALSKRPVKPLNTPAGRVLEKGHGQPRETHWSAFFTDELRNTVFEREWLFFELFPEYAWVREPPAG